jgi:toxin ParE1/3/4
MRIRWTDPAEADFFDICEYIFDICEYIARDNPAAAERVGRRLPSAVDALAAQPRLGRPGRVGGTRELVIPRLPYVAIYRVVAAAHTAAGEVDVLRVPHGARRRSTGRG